MSAGQMSHSSQVQTKENNSASLFTSIIHTQAFIFKENVGSLKAGQAFQNDITGAIQPIINTYIIRK